LLACALCSSAVQCHILETLLARVFSCYRGKCCFPFLCSVHSSQNKKTKQKQKQNKQQQQKQTIRNHAETTGKKNKKKKKLLN